MNKEISEGHSSLFILTSVPALCYKAVRNQHGAGRGDTNERDHDIDVLGGNTLLDATTRKYDTVYHHVL